MMPIAFPSRRSGAAALERKFHSRQACCETADASGERVSTTCIGMPERNRAAREVAMSIDRRPRPGNSRRPSNSMPAGATFHPRQTQDCRRPNRRAPRSTIASNTGWTSVANQR
jgi:hypothetical protein